jgi:hypothetical protein
MYSERFRTKKDDHEQRMKELGMIIRALSLDDRMPLAILIANLIDALDLLRQELEDR